MCDYLFLGDGQMFSMSKGRLKLGTGHDAIREGLLDQPNSIMGCLDHCSLSFFSSRHSAHRHRSNLVTCSEVLCTQLPLSPVVPRGCGPGGQRQCSPCSLCCVLRIDPAQMKCVTRSVTSCGRNIGTGIVPAGSWLHPLRKHLITMLSK